MGKLELHRALEPLLGVMFYCQLKSPYAVGLLIHLFQSNSSILTNFHLFMHWNYSIYCGDISVIHCIWWFCCTTGFVSHDFEVLPNFFSVGNSKYDAESSFLFILKYSYNQKYNFKTQLRYRGRSVCRCNMSWVLRYHFHIFSNCEEARG